MKICLDPHAPNTNFILGAALSGGDARKAAEMLVDAVLPVDGKTITLDSLSEDQMFVTPDTLTRAVVESLLEAAHPNGEAPDPNYPPDRELVAAIRTWIRWDAGGRDQNEYNARRAARVICDALIRRDGV